MSFGLEGKVALVTGGARGIGAGIAVELARVGVSVVVADLDIKRTSVIVEAVRNLGTEAVGLELDVSSRESVQRCVAQAIERFTRIDILVNNAGIFQKHLGFEQDEVDFNHCLDINLTGVWRMVRAIVPHFQVRGAGRIINISSEGGRRGVGFAPGYCASKAAVINLTQSLALALGADRINVNAVCPGAVPTSMQDEIKGALGPAATARPSDLVPALPGPLTAEDIGRAVVFFASGYARNITGQALNVDCGRWMN